MNIYTSGFKNIEENIDATRQMMAYEQGLQRLYEVFIPESEKSRMLVDNETQEDTMMI